MLRLAAKLLSSHTNIMLLADRGLANHELVSWLQNSSWHYCLRLPCDVILHGVRKHPIESKYLSRQKSEAVLCRNVGLWLDGRYRCNAVLANVKEVREPWVVITDENPSLQTLWQYGLRFRVEELFLDSKSGVFQLEDSKIRDYAPRTPKASQSFRTSISNCCTSSFVCHLSWSDTSVKRA